MNFFSSFGLESLSLFDLEKFRIHGVDDVQFEL